MKRYTSLFCITIILLASIWIPAGAASLPISESTQIAFDATHEIVCECDCGGETQTYQYFPNMACSRFDGIECEYGEGSTSELADCTKKAQPIERAAVSSLITSAIAARPFPFSPTLNETDVLDGAEMGAWLDQISATLFGTTFPGFALDEHPLTVGQVYNGYTAVGFIPYSFDLTKVDETETVSGYVDPGSFEVFDLQFAWVQGTLLAGGNAVTTGHVAVTATYVNDPSWKLTFLMPLGGNYPFNLGSRSADSAIGFAANDKPFGDELSFLDADAEAVALESGDACDGCYTTANRDIGRMKRDLKSCLKWAAAGGVVGGLLGLLGGNPATVIGGAALGAELVALACADTAATTYGDIITDFCACLAENDCPPHSACD